ncbi:PREDICTED: premnaspirodiene oxygenase-like [Ipomoea nil]|uniref:premnaspirodiene oxygenase-like n=1 Tax=Ipomoea nil TaxID=35883 RepID=UPI000901F7BB|nr:PREDICTED: premnaspirodiene oxygenase-like [Ipomoea nil]
MEATIIINFICFSFFLCFIILVRRRWKKPKSRRSGKLLPPGPWKLPIIGNLLHLCGSSPAHHVLRDLAKRHGSSSGLMHLQIGEISAVIVSSPEMAKEFLRTHDLVFATRPELMAAKILFYNSSDIVFSPYGDHWRQMRKICVMELLNPKLIRSFSSIRQDEIKHLLTDLRSYLERPVNLSKRISLFTSSLLCRSALGRVFTGKEELIEVLEEMLAILGGFQFEDVFPSWKLLHNLCGNKNRIVKVHRKIDAIIENILKEHQNNFESGHELGQGGEDIIDVLIKLERNGSLQLPITHDIIKAIVLDLFVAGTETSSAVVVWAMSEMMKNPRVLAKAQAEVREAFRGKEKLEEDDIMDQLQYLKSVVKETLRCHPPGPLLGPRECMEETVVCGYTIPAKARVLINAWAISRDPQYWEDPNSFIPERFEKNSADFMGNHFEFLPFGAGRRICPGLVFGFANTLSPLANLLYHFDWSFISGITANTLDMTEMIGLTAGRKNDLFLIPTSPAAC